MVQNSIVIVIVAASIVYVGYSMVKSLSVKTKKNGCAGCSGCDIARKKKDCCS